jgi:hypothetical protein
MSVKHHTFRIEVPEELQPHTEGYVTIDVSCEATLNEILGAFETFVKALGYKIPDNSYLDFVKEDYDND